MSLQATTSHTVGPFFTIGLTRLIQNEIAGPGVAGERWVISGRVLDGDGNPVPDALVELWQANSHGKYAHPDDTQQKPVEHGFKGYGRMPTDDAGKFRFSTIKPGPVPGPDGTPQAPHIAVSIFSRGLQRRLVTRIYFPDEPANAADYALSLVPKDRRATLIAKKAGAGQLEWNVILQGPGETVFFDIGL
ncbi:MAG TPA: protocatechuate 3,4-dioxygenase subunit alpha [Candidatus Acidoferrales bacterium]|nr:protocatechuate 3,4-dioxygenase subunit alpha [Candidatus Acidoferrales bacterium]